MLLLLQIMHDMLFVKYIRMAAQNETDEDGNPVPKHNQIIVFPGMELTLAVPCQALLIFDADLPEHCFSTAMTALALTQNSFEEAKTAETVRIETIDTIQKLYDELDKHNELKDRYIVFPNVTNEGKFSILRDGFHSRYKKMPCIGGYLDGSVSKLKPGNLKKISGEVSEWGNKRIAIIQTSDNRREDFRNLGQHSTWIKWSEPTAEALRQACLAQESRISQDEPALPLTSIESITVSNSKFMGPVSLQLNPQYTALIGGRGTGKSTILEYLRWALCDQSYIYADDKTPEYQKRRKKLIENTLEEMGGSVEVMLNINGIRYCIKRSTKTHELQLKAEGQEFAVVKEANIRALLPIQAYSQKQLSSVGIRLDELKRFVYLPIKTELNNIDNRFESLANDIRKKYTSLRQKRNLENEKGKKEKLLASLIKQADQIREALVGLTEEDRNLIAQNVIYQETENTVKTWQEEISTAKKLFEDFEISIAKFPSTFPESIQALSKKEQSIIKNIHSNVDKGFNKIIQGTSSIKEALASMEDENESLQIQISNWVEALDAFENKYTTAKTKSSAHQSKLQQLSELEQRVKHIRSELLKINTELQSLGDLSKDYKELRIKWILMHQDKGKLIEDECKKLSGYSNNEIKAELNHGEGFDKISEELKKAVSGSNLRKDKIGNIHDYTIGQRNPMEAWNFLIDELEQIALYGQEENETSELPSCPILRSIGFTDNDFLNISRVFNLDSWLDISLIRLEDNPVFKYQAKEGEYIAFQDASAGQQATVLLKTLLNQSGPPLIIDQPEDDLDNRVILDVVEQIWQAKSRRQIVFASHNANLVVNGDSDLVVCCDYRYANDQSLGMIESEGAIDIKVTKESIKKVMEGGDKAFELRSRKYGF